MKPYSAPHKNNSNSITNNNESIRDNRHVNSVINDKELQRKISLVTEGFTIKSPELILTDRNRLSVEKTP